MYLLDTDTLSNLMRRMPSTTLIARMAEAPAELQATSAVTLGELYYGVLRHPTPAQMMQRLQRVLRRNLRVLPFDAEAAVIYGDIRVRLERDGATIGDPDLRIASIALARKLTVVTGNVNHFERVPGLKVENWLAE